MKNKKALELIKHGNYKTTMSGNLYKVQERLYGVKYNEYKQKYVVFEPFIGNQRSVTEFNNPNEVNQYIGNKYHKKELNSEV